MRWRAQQGQLARRRQMLRIRQSGRVAKGRFRETELARLLRHDAGKRFLIARHALGDGHAGIVAGLHDDALQELLQGLLRVDRDHHGGRAGRRAAVAPGVDAHEEFVLELDLPGLQRFEDDGQRHELAHAGGRHEFVGVVLEQHCARIGVHQDRLAGLCGDFGLRLRGGRGRQARKRQRR